MTWNGNGVFEPPGAPEFPAVANDVIRAAYYNTVIQLLCDGFLNTVPRDGQAPMAGNLDFTNAYRILNLLPAVQAGQAVTYEQLQAAINMVVQSDWTVTDTASLAFIKNKPWETIAVAFSDETTALAAGTAKVTFHMPMDFALYKVKVGVSTAATAGTPAFDLNDDGVSVFTTVVTLDTTEKFSDTAAVAAVLTANPVNIAKGSVMTIDIDVAGTGTKGAKMYLIGRSSGTY